MPAPQPGSSPDPAADLPERITLADVQAAQRRLDGQLRRPPVSRLTEPAIGGTVYLMHEYLQHTGSFKARGALNLTEAYRQRGGLPAAGLVIASGGNAGLAAAWAARAAGVPATVFVPVTVPAMKLAQLHRYGAEVRQVGSEYAEALQASRDHAEQSGALLSHAYDNPLIAAGAGSCAGEVLAQLPDLDTIVVAVGGGGLLAGTIAATELAGCRVLAVEPEQCQALAAALRAGSPVDVRPVSVAADSLGARRVSQMAYQLACAARVRSVLVTDQAIVAARKYLWQHWRIVVEHGGATALAALLSGSYRPAPDERVAVVLCGANTDPADLTSG